MEKEEMQINDKPTSRQRLAERYRASRPDIKWDEVGEDYDYDELAADELEEFDKERKGYKDANDKMNELFGKDEMAARLFLEWSNGQDPIEKLIEYYGDDFTEALQSEEGKEKFKAALEKWRTGKKAEQEHQAAYDANIEETAKNLVAFADAKGLDDDQMKEIVTKCHQFGSDVLEGRYPMELLELVYKAGNYDKAVAEAEEEGRVKGKSENIRRELRESKPATGLPPTVGGQDAISTEGASRPREGKISMFGGIPVGGKRK